MFLLCVYFLLHFLSFDIYSDKLGSLLIQAVLALENSPVTILKSNVYMPMNVDN